MFEAFRNRILALLRVPPEPQAPLGDPASLRVFRAGRNYYRLRMGTWATAQLLALLALAFWTAILIAVEQRTEERKAALAAVPSAGLEAGAVDPAPAETEEKSDTGQQARNWIERTAERVKAAADGVATGDPDKRPTTVRGWFEGYRDFFVELALMLPGWAFSLIWAVKIASFVIYMVQLPITYAVRRIDYEMRWYMVTDRSLRLRHGVWNVAESTMSFANIQQVVVTRGPIQRLLGLSDVNVQSAGGGNGKALDHGATEEDLHHGRFRHVTNAHEIRDLILDRLRRYRETGLGDPDDARPEPDASPVPPSGTTHDVRGAVQEVLAEARALRESVR